MEDGRARGGALDEPLLPQTSGLEDGEALLGQHVHAAPLGTTVVQASLSIMNIMVCTGMLSMPYALRLGGWAALGVLGALLPLFALSGLLIVWAFDRLPAHVPRTYPDLGHAAAGAAGRRAVLCCSFLELFGGSCILLMVAWRMAELLLPPGLGPFSSTQLAAAVCSCALLPVLFIDIRQGLARLSAVGLASSGLVVLLVGALLLLDPRRGAMEQPPPGHHGLSLGVIQAAGIFALSSTAHSTLPALRIAMRQPVRFPLALGGAFSAMLVCYTSVAACGYWYFGDSASPLVTTDLATNSYFTGGRLPIDRMLAAFVLVTSITKYPGLVLCLQDMLLSALPLSRDEHGAYHPPLHYVVYGLRLALFAVGVLLGLTAYDALGAALSMLGGLGSISASLVLPTTFFALLAWRGARPATRVALAALLLLAGGMVVLITGMNVCDLVPRCAAARRSWDLAAHAPWVGRGGGGGSRNGGGSRQGGGGGGRGMSSRDGGVQKNGGGGGGRGGGRGGRGRGGGGDRGPAGRGGHGGRGDRSKPKTAADLEKEMDEYWMQDDKMASKKLNDDMDDYWKTAKAKKEEAAAAPAAVEAGTAEGAAAEAEPATEAEAAAE
ncbi:Vacuolar amino acid transporter 1 [Micractinium conductrix]|uniref:Vacuolar amino acid transporter 1 n=1 Tax=Micractinium conductrix TaxID=554055 RepID=A0A2P6VEE1_9CHLO|nr:Vacuolar amino acid transporter 1 [Micractinium conductrix]|eukprot:PSC72470.1 Vacuolar amino acid transporter 1 [Micractinium conductrix]